MGSLSGRRHRLGSTKGLVLEQFLDDSSPLANQLAKDYIALRKLGEGDLPRAHYPVVMAVVNQKGGVGKTTSTVNLAAAFALGGLRVAVIDVDPQGNASTALGIPHLEGTPSVYEVLLGEMTLREVMQPCPDVPGVEVAPATIDLAGAEIELVNASDRSSALRNAIDVLLSEDDRPDVILIDCPPSLGVLTLNALVASDGLLVPVQAEYYALEGLSMLTNTVDKVKETLNPDLSDPYILITMSDGRTRLSADVVQEVRSHFGGRVLKTEVARSVRIAEAPSFSQTVITYDPRSTGSVAYREAAKELAERFVLEEALNE